MNAEIHTFVFNSFISLNSLISPQRLLCEMLIKLHQLNLIKTQFGVSREPCNSIGELNRTQLNSFTL